MEEILCTSSDIRNELERIGFGENVVDPVVRLINMIVFFDNRVCASHISIRFSHTINPDHPDDIAGYCKKDKKGDEYYCIFVPQVKTFLDKECLSKDYTHMLLHNVPIKDCPNFTRDKVLTMVAAHEVRHRLQRNGVKIFHRKNRRLVKDPLVRNAMRWVSILFKDTMNSYREEKKSYALARRRINPLEFDSRVIECCIGSAVQNNEVLGKDMHLLQSQPFIDKFISILRMEPSA